MEDALVVRVVNRFSDLLYVTCRFFVRQWVTANQFGQILSLDIIHREEMVPVMNADIVDGDDIGMLERRRCRRFRPKAMDELARGKLAAKDQLQRHRSSKAALTRTINNAHSAPGNFIEQFVITEDPGC